MNLTFITVFGFFIIFIATSLGAALSFFFTKDVSKGLNSVFSGLAAGIMVAASIWSLILPAIERSAHLGAFAFFPSAFGFLLGGAFMVFIDAVFFKGRKTANIKTAKTFIAITVHNIPEGLAVGFAFGAAHLIGTEQAFLSALGLAVGIAVQNLPEGAAVALPLKRAGASKMKPFLFGVLSGAVEPVAAVAGYYLAFALTAIQPYLLAFSAGAMIFVVAEDLIPESALANDKGYGTWAVMIGFALMMALDVALG